MRPTLLLFSLAILGCGTPFDPPSYLKDFRIIGVQAEPPEIPAGATTALTAIFSAAPDTSDAAVNDIKFDWYRCALSPVISSGLGVNPLCIPTIDKDKKVEPIDPKVLVSLSSGTGTDGAKSTMVMPDMGSPFSPSLPLGLPDSTGGWYVPVVLVATQGTKTIITVYRMRLAVFGTPNKNPKLDQILHVTGDYDGGDFPDAGPLMFEPITDDGMPVQVHRDQSFRVRATVTADSPEPYTQIDDLSDPMNIKTHPVTEKPRYDWYTTGGEFSVEVTGDALPDTELTFKEDARRPANGQTITLWVVVHDDRGGVDFGHRTLLFVDP
jgi:hypothetical protein